MLALSRQNLPPLRTSSEENRSRTRRAMCSAKPTEPRDVTLLATGSEVSLAMNAAKILREGGKRVAVVSMPSWELFEAQSEDYRRATLGAAPRIGVEAAARFGWDRWIGERGPFIGMSSFGASGPIADVYKHFGVTVEAVVEAAKKLTA